MSAPTDPAILQERLDGVRRDVEELSPARLGGTLSASPLPVAALQSHLRSATTWLGRVWAANARNGAAVRRWLVSEPLGSPVPAREPRVLPLRKQFRLSLATAALGAAVAAGSYTLTAPLTDPFFGLIPPDIFSRIPPFAENTVEPSPEGQPPRLSPYSPDADVVSPGGGMPLVAGAPGPPLPPGTVPPPGAPAPPGPVLRPGTPGTALPPGTPGTALPLGTPGAPVTPGQLRIAVPNGPPTKASEPAQAPGTTTGDTTQHQGVSGTTSAKPVVPKPVAPKPQPPVVTPPEITPPVVTPPEVTHETITVPTRPPRTTIQQPPQTTTTQQPPQTTTTYQPPRPTITKTTPKPTTTTPTQTRPTTTTPKPTTTTDKPPTRTTTTTSDTGDGPS
jgi:hypothetical protein